MALQASKENNFQITNKYRKRLCVFAVEMYSRRHVWTWFDVNRSTFDEDSLCAKNGFHISVPNELDL